MPVALFAPVFAIALVTACSSETRIHDAADLDVALDSIASEVLSTGPVAGLAVAVIRGGEPVYIGAHGMADLATSRAATHETVYVAASVTKLITSLAMLSLVRDGRIELDHLLADRLPSFPNREQANQITIRSMLNHTSGLPDLVAVANLRWQEEGIPVDRHFVLEWLRGRPLDFEPGTHWMYSNTAFYLLGMIVEEVTGQPYGDYVREEIAIPLGLMDTFLCDDSLRAERRTIGYEATDSGLVRNSGYETAGVRTGFRAAGGLCSTAIDLASLPAALVETGFLPDSLLAEMRRPTVISNGTKVNYGLGVRLGSLNGHAVWGHSGGSSSTWAILAHYPDSEVTVAVMVNTDRASEDAWVLQGRVARRVLGIAEPVVDSGAPSELALYEGRFVGGRGDREFVLRAEGARLLIQEVGQEREPSVAVPVGLHDFALVSNPNDRVTFEVRDGEVLGYSVSWDGLFWNFRRPVAGYR